jgi:hypothetical protein
MKHNISVFLLSMILLLLLSNCNNSSDKNKAVVQEEKTAVQKDKAAPIEKAIDTAYTGWQPGKGEKVTFKYPANWIMRTTDREHGTYTYGFIKKTVKDFGNFFVFEIHEIETLGRPFKDFKFASIGWLQQSLGSKTTVRNTEDIKFNGAEARKYEIDVEDPKRPYVVDLYAVNGIGRYYMLVYFKSETDEANVKGIMNSIRFYE